MAEAWRLTFASRTDLERVVRAVSDINRSITIVIKNDEEFKGILVEDMHTAQTCLIRARLACDVTINDINSNMSFTCDCKAFLHVLKATKSQYRLDIVRPIHNDRIVLESFDSMQTNYRSKTSLNTIETDQIEFQELREMDFKFSLRIEAAFLKSVLKNNKELQADRVRLELRNSSSYDVTLVRIVCESPVSTDVKEFVSNAALEEADQMEVHNDSVPEQPWDKIFTEQVFDGMFDVDCILNFIKSVDPKPNLLFKLASDTPLLIETPLCSPNSSIFLLVSACVE